MLSVSFAVIEEIDYVWYDEYWFSAQESYLEIDIEKRE